MVASPRPIRIVEEAAVRTLLDAGMVVITVGGGALSGAGVGGAQAFTGDVDAIAIGNNAQAMQSGSVALGLDASETDPFGGLAITTDGFARIAEAIAGLGLPSLLVQEGGYLSDELGANLAAFLGAFEAASP